MKIYLKIIVPLLCVLLLFLFIDCSKVVVIGSSKPQKNNSTHPILKIFLENSGSMDGYMCDGSDLKDAIYDYIGDLSKVSDSTSLYFINKKLIPYSGNLKSFVKDMTPATFHSAGGDTGNTDIEELIGMVLSTVNDTTVSIFISDCILDLPSKNSLEFLKRCEISIKQDIAKAQKMVPDLGVQIFQLTSKFKGKYFYPNGKDEILDNVQRPYYIWIFGSSKYIAEFNKKVPYTLLDKYNLKGVISFSNFSESQYETKNRSFSSNILMPKNKYYLVTMKADLSKTLQPEDVIQDKKNYKFVNNSIEIESVIPIDKKIDKSNYTHIINFKIPEGTKIAQDRVMFNALSALPSWVTLSNDDTGMNIQNNLAKTTGIRYLIAGIQDAYKDINILSTFNFSIKQE